MYDALYARQSIERPDSISVESQLEYCRCETHGGAYREYADRGYSGKNTNRPAFEQMLADIRRGHVSRVIVYKLDRISRSILDFANMMDVFQTYHVEFVSSTERFDTSTPIGRAMLNICIVFAQLERETIQKRVSDAYYSRCKRGFYMGGRIPYGFSKTDTVIDGTKTSMYLPLPQEAAHIRLMFALYADPRHSLGDVVTYFNDHRITHARGGVWSTARISAMLANPIYVKADTDVYRFFKEQGADIINPVCDFTGYHACYLYRGENTSRRQSDFCGKQLVLAPHEGIVSSQDWIACRKRALYSRRSTQTCKPKNSWLSGKVKCAKCGHSLKITKADTRWHRYFVCSASLASKKAACPGTGTTIYADVLERYIQNAIRKKLAGFPALKNESTSSHTDTQEMQKIAEQKTRLAQLDEEIDKLVARLPGASDTLAKYIDEKISQLDAQRQTLQAKAAALRKVSAKDRTGEITNHVRAWDTLSFEERQAVADVLIQVIEIADGEMKLVWKS